MSLRIWLPLDGNLNNKGISSNVVVTNNGATVDNSGKIGKCYSFNGSSSYIASTGYTDFGDSFTVSFWFCCTVSPSTTQILICNRFDTYSGLMIFLQNGKLQIDPTAESYSSSTRWVTSFSPSTNKWYHLTVTRTFNQMSYYVDGEFKESKSVRFYSAYGSNIYLGKNQLGYFFGGKLNDFRVYDNALSVTEIKELSRGLVRHYKFDNMNSSLTTTAISYIVDSSGYSNHGDPSGTLSMITDSARNSMSTVFNGTDSKVETDSLPTETQTVSFWLKTTWRAPSVTKVIMVDLNTSIALVFTYNRIVVMSRISSGSDKCKMYTIASTGYTANQWNHICIVKTGNTTRDLYINGAKETPISNVDSWEHNLDKLLIGCRYKEGLYQTYGDFKMSDFRAYVTKLSEDDIMNLYNVGAKITDTGEFHNYELVENTTATNTSVKNTGVAIATSSGINENMLKTVPKLVSPTQYNAYQLEFTENLVAGQTYTLQLWDVDVSHTGKTEAQLGVWVYWGGGSTQLFSWSGTSNFTNGHSDYLVKTFTVTSSQASGSGAGNSWFNIYNSTSYVAGTMNMRIGKWKLEKGSVPTAYVDDHTYSGYLGVNHGFIENDLLPRNSVATKIHKGYIETKEFIED